MIVHFDGKTDQYIPVVGLTLKPGDNEVGDEQAEALIAAKVIKKSATKAGKKEK